MLTMVFFFFCNLQQTDAMFRLTTVLSGTGVVHGSPHRVGAKSDFVADEEMPAFKDRHTRYERRRTKEEKNERTIHIHSLLHFPSTNKVNAFASEIDRAVQMTNAYFKQTSTCSLHRNP